MADTKTTEDSINTDMSDIKDNKNNQVKQTNDDEKESKKFVYEIKTIQICGKQIDLPLVSLMLMNFFLNAACSVITPFFPPLAKKINLNNFQIGLVIGIHPLSGFMFGMIMSKYLNNFGRKRVMLGSLITTIITCVGMGLSYLAKDTPTLFFIINLVCRSFMGMARSGYGSATFAYAPMLWPHKVEKMIGLLESATGLGLMTGPLIGAAIAAIFQFNDALKYQMVFYILSGIFAIFVYPSYTMLPIDQKIPPKQKTLSLFHVLGRRQIWTLYFLLTLCSTSITFTYELWTVHLQTYGITEILSAVLLTSGSMTYIVSLQVVPRLMAHYIRGQGIISFRKLLEALGLGISAFLLLFIAPETKVGIPQEAWPLVTGMFIAGFAQGLAILPYIPEQNMLVVKYYPKNQKLALAESLTTSIEAQMQQVKDETGKDFTQEDVEANVGEIIRKLYSDMASGMFMSAYSLGTFSGPTVGGFIFDILEKSQNAINSECKWWKYNDGTKTIPENEIINPCANQFAFKNLARMIQGLCVLFLILYLTLGEGYIGFKEVCCRKKKQQLKVEAVKRSMSTDYNAKQGNLTDALLTDNDNQFTDAENGCDYDAETEQKLANIIERTKSQMASDEGMARSSSIIM